MCLFFLNGSRASLLKQGSSVIPPTSGLLSHISQLGGNQIKPDEISGRFMNPCDELAYTHTHTHSQITRRLMIPSAIATPTLTGAQKRHLDTHKVRRRQIRHVASKPVNGARREPCQRPDVTCAPRHVLDSDRPIVLKASRSCKTRQNYRIFH